MLEIIIETTVTKTNTMPRNNFNLCLEDICLETGLCETGGFKKHF